METRAPEKSIASPAVQSAGAYPWIADAGDGTFRNPILYADYSDPDVIRVGDDFYLTASSFNCTPGLPILHSKDLVNWTIINHAVKNLPHPRYAEVQPGCGIWAPAMRFHAGKYWIFFPMPDEGIYVTTAEHPAGQWSEPHLLQAGRGLIDPCPLWDDDGQAFLVHAYAGSRAGIKHLLRVCPMAPDGSKILGEGKIVFHEPEKHPTVEGPKFLKKDGWYYILAPAGGVATGWQLALRARNVYGPYEARIVLAQGCTNINGPHQGALVDTAAGDWWFVHFQDAGVYGRVTHLQPVQWQDGWPMMGTHGEPVLHHSKPKIAAEELICAPATSDEFEAAILGLQWQWTANHRDEWFQLGGRDGKLMLYPQPLPLAGFTKIPNLLLQKFPARSFIVETALDFSALQPGEEAGLVLLGKAYAALGVLRTSAKTQIFLRRDDEAYFIATTSSNCVRLCVQIHDGGECQFSFADHGEFVIVPKTFQAQPGNWIGAKVGVYAIDQTRIATAGFAKFHYFHFLSANSF